MAIQGVVFDFGHTLMHLGTTWQQVFEEGAADLAAYIADRGLGVNGHDFARTLLERRKRGFVRAKESMREVTAGDSMRWTFAQFGLADPGPALVRGAIDAFFAAERSHWQPDPEALPVLERLRGSGLQVGLFSNATDDLYIQELVDDLGFRPWLDPALTSAGTGIRKPDPAAFAPVLAAWRLPPESVAMVGDTLDADILGAQRAGMWSVWIPAGSDARQEGRGYDAAISPGLAEPDVTLDRLGQLPACLDDLSRSG